MYIKKKNKHQVTQQICIANGLQNFLASISNMWHNSIKQSTAMQIQVKTSKNGNPKIKYSLSQIAWGL